MRYRLWAAALALTAVPAVAQAPLYELRGRPLEIGPFIWRDAAAMRDGHGLIQTGIFRDDPGRVTRLLACNAFGSPVVVLEPGPAMSAIAVVEGPSAGCRGVVASGDLVPIQPPNVRD